MLPSMNICTERSPSGSRDGALAKRFERVEACSGGVSVSEEIDQPFQAGN